LNWASWAEAIKANARADINVKIRLLIL
jgi:hypothetical protein